MPHWLLLILSIIFMLPGLGFVLLPMFPAIPYMFLVALCYGLVDGFSTVSGFHFWILGGIVIISILIDQLAGIVGAKYGGASRKALLFGFVGAIIGTILFPPFGGLMGIFGGVLLAEILLNKSRHAAMRAATGALIGSTAGMATNAFLALLFLILFIIFAF